MTVQLLQINESILRRMTSQKLNDRMAKICFDTMGMERTPAQVAELNLIQSILRERKNDDNSS